MKETKKRSNGKKGKKQRVARRKLPPLPPVFKSMGINSPYTLYSASLKGQLDNYARWADLNPADVKRWVDRIAKAIPIDVKKVLEEDAAKPVVTGHIDWSDPRQKKFYESI